MLCSSQTLYVTVFARFEERIFFEARTKVFYEKTRFMGSFNLEIEAKLKILTLKFDICAIFRGNSLSCFGEVGRSFFFLQASVSRQKYACHLLF